MTHSANHGPDLEGPHLLRLRPAAGGGVADLLEALAWEVATERSARGAPPVPVVLDAAAGRTVAADPESLRQVIGPLLEAACEAAATAVPRLREVVVTTVDTGVALEIEVADSGPGVPPAALSTTGSPVARLGGSLVCRACPEGGLAVTLRLPHARLGRRAA